jgi:hypothetical protein
VTEDRESHKGIAAAASQLMNSDLQQTSRDDDGSTNTHSQKLSTSKPPSNASGWKRERPSATAVAGRTQQVINDKDFTVNITSGIGRKSSLGMDDTETFFEERLQYQSGDWTKNFKELCEYRRSKGYCNFRCQDPEYAELSKWMFSQRCEYRRMVGAKDCIWTPERVKALEGIGFVWRISSRPSWEDRLSEFGLLA